MTYFPRIAAMIYGYWYLVDIYTWIPVLSIHVQKRNVDGLRRSLIKLHCLSSYCRVTILARGCRPWIYGSCKTSLFEVICLLPENHLPPILVLLDNRLGILTSLLESVLNKMVTENNSSWLQLGWSQFLLTSSLCIFYASFSGFVRRGKNDNNRCCI